MANPAGLTQQHKHTKRRLARCRGSAAEGREEDEGCDVLLFLLLAMMYFFIMDATSTPL